jgi:hypothetical protein
MLVAVIANNIIIYRAYDSSTTPVPPPDSAATAAVAPPTSSSTPGEKPLIPIPSWRGEVALEKAPNGGYDVVVQALQRGTDTPLPMTAVNADIRKADENAAEMTLSFKRTAGLKFAAHADLTPGTWDVRVHIHRDSQTLEFSERFDLKD